MATPKDLQREILLLTMMLERTRPVSLTEFEKVMSEALDEVILKIIKAKSPMTITQSREILKSIKDLLTPIYKDFPEWIRLDEELALKMSYETTVAAMVSLPFVIENKLTAVSFNKINKDQIDALLSPNRQLGSMGLTLNDLIGDTQDAQYKRARQILAKGVTAKHSPSQITNDMRQLFTDITKNKAETIVRTAILDSAEIAQHKSYEQFDEVIIGYRSRAVLDDRTSDICVFYHDKVWKRKSGETQKQLYERIPDKPKRHPRCRSILIPETKDTKKQFEQTTVPAAEGKGKDRTFYRLRADATFDEFFSTISPEAQAKLVGGKEKARLMREGKLSFKDVLKKQRNGEIKYLTNDEIKEIYQLD